MRRTTFAGLTQLDPGESLATDGFSFQSRNPDIEDAFLKLGAQTHRHDAHPALERPSIEPSATVVASGGAFPADVELTVGYTVIDSQGGETLVSPTDAVTTPPGIESPETPPTASADYSGGQLTIDTYYYLKTWIDDGGGETPAGPFVQVERAPGYASGQVQLSGLTDGMDDAGAVGWKVYKASSNGIFILLAQGAGDTLTDDGTLCTDCVARPPTVNTTHMRNTLLVEIPAVMPTGSVSFRIYVGLGVGFGSPSLMGEYPVASAGETFTYTSYTPVDGRPPDVPTSIAGANQINPDTDILDWHWKRPVTAYADLPSGELGDVRMTEENFRLFSPSAEGVGSAGWREVPGNVIVEAASGNLVDRARHILFVPSGEVSLNVVDHGAGLVEVRIYAPSAASGGGGGGSGGGSLFWKDPVADYASLPSSGNTNGDIRITLDRWAMFIWDTDTWYFFPGSSIQPPQLNTSWLATGWVFDPHVGSSSGQNAALNSPRFYKDTATGVIHIQGAFKRSASGVPAAEEQILKIPDATEAEWGTSAPFIYKPSQSFYAVVPMYNRDGSSPFNQQNMAPGVVYVRADGYGDPIGGDADIVYISGGPASGNFHIDLSTISYR